MKDVTDMPKEELQGKLNRHIEDARLQYQRALLGVCVEGQTQLKEFKRCAEIYSDLCRAQACLAGE